MEEERVKPYTPTVNYWLLGSDPGQFSYADLEREFSTRWDGVTDYVALKFLRDIDSGDQAMICETGDEPKIVGVVRVVSDAYPDPLQDDPAFMAVDVEPVGRLDAPVPLDAILDDPDFSDLDIEDLGELSVVPLSPRLWERILELSGGSRPGEVSAAGEDEGAEAAGREREDPGREPAAESRQPAALVGEERR